MPEHLLGPVLAMRAHGADHVAQPVHGGGGAVAGVRGGKARHLLVDERAGQQLLARHRRGRRRRVIRHRSVSGGGLPLLALLVPPPDLLAVRGEQEPADAAQAQVVGVPEGAAQELRGGAGLERRAVGGEAELEDRQEIRDHGDLPQRLGTAGDPHGQAGAGETVGDIGDGRTGAAHHGHVVVLDPLAVVQVPQGRADQARLVQGVPCAQGDDPARELRAGPTGAGRGAGEREPSPQRVDRPGERRLAGVGAVEGDLQRHARQQVPQPGGGVGERAAEGVHRGIGAAGREHPRTARGERRDELDAGGGEVLRVVDHDGAEGRGDGRVAQERRGAAHQGAGVEAGARIERGGGLEVQHPEVVAQQRGRVAPGGPVVLAAQRLERRGAQPQLPGTGDEVAQLGAEAGERAGPRVDLEVPASALGDQLREQGVLLRARDEGRLAESAAQRLGAGDGVGEGGRGHGARRAASVHGEGVAQPPGGEAARGEQQRLLSRGVGGGEGEGGAAAAGTAVDEDVLACAEGREGATLALVEPLPVQQGGQRGEVGSEQADALPRDRAGASHGPIAPHGDDVRGGPARTAAAVQWSGSPPVPIVRSGGRSHVLTRHLPDAPRATTLPAAPARDRGVHREGVPGHVDG